MPTRIERLRAEYARGFGIHRAQDIDALFSVVDAARSYFDEPCSIGAKRVIEALAALEEEA